MSKDLGFFTFEACQSPQMTSSYVWQLQEAGCGATEGEEAARRSEGVRSVEAKLWSSSDGGCAALEGIPVSGLTGDCSGSLGLKWLSGLLEVVQGIVVMWGSRWRVVRGLWVARMPGWRRRKHCS